MSLKDWLKNGWLVEHRTSPQEIRNLLGVADRDLDDCRAAGLSADWKMNIAYNAALQATTAALAACGFRASRDSHHYRIIQSLAFTLEMEAKLIAKFDKFRKKRNIGGYEQAGLISEQEAEEMISLAEQLREATELWLQSNHPELL
jgi:hypothetical protein